MSSDLTQKAFSFAGIETLHQLPQIQLARLQTYDISSIGDVFTQLQPNQYIDAKTRGRCCFFFHMLRLAAGTWPSKADSTLLEAVDDCIKACQLPTSKWLSATTIKGIRAILFTKVLPVFLCLATVTELDSMHISPTAPPKSSSVWTNRTDTLRPVVTALLKAGAKLVWFDILPSSGGEPSTVKPNRHTLRYAVRAFAESESQLVQTRKTQYPTLQIHFIDNDVIHEMPIAEPKFVLSFRVSSMEDPFSTKLPRLLLKHGALLCCINPSPVRDEDCRIIVSLNGKSKEEFEKSVRMDLRPTECEIVSLFSYSETPSRVTHVQLDCGEAGTPWRSVMSQLDFSQNANANIKQNSNPSGSIGAFLVDE